MSIEIKTPILPESVADALIVNWTKKVGDSITQDELLVEIETDKVVLEVPAPCDGVLESILEDEGATVIGEQLLGYINDSAGVGTATTNQAEQATPEPQIEASTGQTSPAVRKALDENALDAEQVSGSGKNGRILKEDVNSHLQQGATTTSTTASSKASSSTAMPELSIQSDRVEERVPMTRLRKRVAERLLEATQTTAMLTTFNEVNMKPLMDMRSQYKDKFEKTHEVKLGFMSMFVKAASIALQRYPEVNASVDGDDIVYHGYSDIGIAVSSPRGLVVPILRDAQSMSLADVESSIANYAVKAREGKLDMEDLQGGTFTITNGGVFGSLFSTPILNPPQSAILGMHGITKRAVVENDEIVIRPMMYIALSYDHRIIDGQGAVLCLRTIKELVEDPNRILLEV